MYEDQNVPQGFYRKTNDIRNFYLTFLFVLKLPCYVIIHRVLKFIRIRFYFLKVFRSRYVINHSELNVRSKAILSQMDFSYLFFDQYDEEVTLSDAGVHFRVGEKQVLLDLHETALNKNDYLYPYLFWYFNWINSSTVNATAIENLISRKSGLAFEAHAVSNRMINLIASANKIDSEHLLNSLVDDYNRLIFSTEEYVGGNHLIDNYLALILFSKICEREDSLKYFDKKIYKILKTYKYFPENNPSYIKILSKKLCFIMQTVGCGYYSGLEKLSNLLSESQKSFGNFLFHDAYNCKNFLKASSQCHHRINRSFYFLDINKSISIFFGTNLESDSGFNGHDHDNNSLLEVDFAGYQVIGGKGTICYANNFRRKVNKTALMSSVIRPKDYPSKVSIGCFRSIQPNFFTYKTSYNNAQRNFRSVTTYRSGGKVLLNATISNAYTHICYESTNTLYLNFYTECEWTVREDAITCGIVTIEGVVLLRKAPSCIYKGLYRKRSGTRIQLCTLSNRMIIKINA